jgi:hypothetical protein
MVMPCSRSACQAVEQQRQFHALVAALLRGARLRRRSWSSKTVFVS